tara:strand:- start:524 stop:1093 length:570 start_codon:yes stop_codon:yes gene_type:complete
MALIPKYTITFSHSKGDYFKLYDITEEYNASTNAAGWGSPNDVMSDITSAIVTVFDYSDTLLITQDVTSVYPVTVEDTIQVATLNWGLVDGYYKFIITMIVNGTTYVSTVETVYFGNALNSAEDLWFNAFPNQDCSCPNVKLLELAKEAEILLYAIKSAGTSLEISNINKITNASKKIQNFANRYCTVL